MSIFTRLVISGMGLGRIAIGLAPMLAPATSAKLLGFPASHDNATARLMGRFFGVRDIGLGILALWSVRHPETLGFMMLFQAAMDFGDLYSIAIPLVRRQGIDRAAASSAMFALIGGLSWVVMWLIAG